MTRAAANEPRPECSPGLEVVEQPAIDAGAANYGLDHDGAGAE